MQTVEIQPMSPASQIVTEEAINVRLPGTPVRYYWHGWQSWSLAAWTEASRTLPVGKPYIVHPSQTDPAYAFHPRPHGSWVGAVEMGDGGIVLLGSLGTDAHVELDGGELKGSYEGKRREWLIATGDEQTVFSLYAKELEKRLGPKSRKPTPRVWCSWYSLYESIDERTLSEVFKDLRDLPFDVLQVDDGWQLRVGDWEANRKFRGGMQSLQQRIKATGHKAGIWLAPLIAVKSSRLFRDHPDWFLRDKRGRLVSAGFNWGEQLYALDTTHPLVIQWLKDLMQKMRAWGYPYVKLDFLYAGALPGVRHNNMPREEAYRQALRVMRDAMGDDAYLLACGAPIIPSLGLCDAIRIGPDIGRGWKSHRDDVLLHNPAIPGTRNAIRTALHRLWLKGLVQLDPDTAYFSSIGSDLTPEQRDLLQGLALICGFKATSDLPGWLTDAEREQLHQFLLAEPRIEQTGPLSFKVDGRELDYSTAMELAAAPSGWDRLRSSMLGWLANHGWTMRIGREFGKLGKRVRVRRK